MVVAIVLTAIVTTLVLTYVGATNNEEEIEKEIYFALLDYGIDETNSIWFKTGFINDYEETDAKLRVEIQILTFKNRTISDRLPVLMETWDIKIEEGATSQNFTGIETINNLYYSLKVSLIVDEKVIDSDYMMINKE